MIKGTCHSEETKKKMRLSAKRNPNNFLFKKGNTFGFKKGDLTWANKGLTKETSPTLMKISKSLTGKPLSKEHIRKSVETRIKNGNNKAWNKGKKLFPEHIKKLKLAHLGVKLSKEHRKAQSKGHIGLIRTVEHCKHLSESLTGKKLSEKHKINIGIGTKKGMDNEEIRTKMREWRKNQILPIKDTTIEVKIQDFLKQLGISFLTHQYMKDIEHGYQCDILIPSMNLVIECDGNYWHKYPVGLEKDHVRTKELIEKGFKVLRLWESEIRELTLDKFKEKIT